MSEDDDPSTILVNFLQFLYSNLPEFESFCLDKSFLRALASTLFSFDDEHGSEAAASEVCSLTCYLLCIIATESRPR